MGSDNRQTPFTDTEYEAFIKQTVREDWNASRETDALHDISITHPEKNREILIDSARNRLSYRKTGSDEWGLQQKPVSDLDRAVTKLQTVALFVPMNEMHYLGLGPHPDPPDDTSTY